MLQACKLGVWITLVRPSREAKGLCRKVKPGDAGLRDRIVLRARAATYADCADDFAADD